MKQNKKGFTIVELVIVIAVIAILSAVLIPTFSSIIKKSKESVDQQAIRQMNMVLATEAIDGEIDSIEDVRKALTEAGFNADSYVPLSSDTVFVWLKEHNEIALAKPSGQEGSETYSIVFPANIEGTFTNGVNAFPLEKQIEQEPNAQVDWGENQPGMPATPTDCYGMPIKKIDLFSFRPIDKNVEDDPLYKEQREAYGTWLADFQIILNSDLSAYSAGICGSYWGIPWRFIVSDVNLTAGMQFSLLAMVLPEGNVESLEDLASYSSGIPYADLLGYCEPDANGDREGFHCGVFDLSGDNEGKSITVELRLYKPDPNDRNKRDASGEYIVCERVDYTFTNPNA